MMYVFQNIEKVSVYCSLYKDRPKYLLTFIIFSIIFIEQLHLEDEAFVIYSYSIIITPPLAIFCFMVFFTINLEVCLKHFLL